MDFSHSAAGDSIRQIWQRAHGGKEHVMEAKKGKDYSKIIKLKYILRHLMGLHGQSWSTDSLIGQEKIIKRLKAAPVDYKSGN